MSNLDPQDFSVQTFDSVQVLRAVAALSIVLIHFQLIELASFGVDIFFCVSGFIMMYKTQAGSRHFLARRIVRIVPYYWLCTLMMIAVWLVMPNVFHNANPTLPKLIQSFLFIPYFDASANSPILRLGWTLNLEMMFYLILMTACAIKLKYRALIAGSVLIAFSVLGFALKPPYPFAGWTDSVIIEFALGMVAYYTVKYIYETVKVKTPLRCLCAALSVSALLFMILFQTQTLPRFIYLGIPSLVLFISFFTFSIGLKLPPLAVFLGNISFSIYLLHPFVLYFFERVVFKMDGFNAITIVMMVVSFVAVILASWLGWFVMEKKFTGFLRKKLKL